jgi:hypothetical protein
MNDVGSFRDRTGFDGDLQMFRETAKPVNLEHLQFLRWLIEHGRLEHPAVRLPQGEAAWTAESNPR